MNAHDRILEVVKKAPALEGLFDAQVRHYTNKQHVFNVLSQFEEYFAYHFYEIEIDVFRLFLLLHDIGKPIAYKKGNLDNQCLETIRIISENKEKLNLEDKDFLLFKALLSAECFGWYMQGKASLEDSFLVIKEQSNISRIELKSFFYLLSVYYQCDAASYTEDAGGFKHLEYLFYYENDHKKYDLDLKLLKFSAGYHFKYISMLNKISANIETEKKPEAIAFPSNLRFISGNIFNSKAQTIVNTVNCVGIMGKGIALVYKLRYPLMFEIYKNHCDQKYIGIGKLWLYNQQPNIPWVLNFPTKYHWKYPSKLEYIQKGLIKFSETYKEKGITSIAFPLLGTHNGGLEKEDVKLLMIEHLSKCDIPIEVYDYDPSSSDDLFEKFKNNWKKLSPKEINAATGMQPQYIRKLSEVLEDPEVYSMIALVNYAGIGERTLQKSFDFAMNYKQEKLF